MERHLESSTENRQVRNALAPNKLLWVSAGKYEHMAKMVEPIQ